MSASILRFEAPKSKPALKGKSALVAEARANAFIYSAKFEAAAESSWSTKKGGAR